LKSEKFTCVICPVGCKITVRFDVKNDEILIKEIIGAKCEKGENYVKKELISPSRILTTSVKVNRGNFPLVSVKTDRPIPKKIVWKVMEIIKNIIVDAPINCGDVIYSDPELKFKLIATRKITRNIN